MRIVDGKPKLTMYDGEVVAQIEVDKFIEFVRPILNAAYKLPPHTLWLRYERSDRRLAFWAQGTDLAIWLDIKYDKLIDVIKPFSINAWENGKDNIDMEVFSTSDTIPINGVDCIMFRRFLNDGTVKYSRDRWIKCDPRDVFTVRTVRVREDIRDCAKIECTLLSDDTVWVSDEQIRGNTIISEDDEAATITTYLPNGLFGIFDSIDVDTEEYRYADH